MSSRAAVRRWFMETPSALAVDGDLGSVAPARGQIVDLAVRLLENDLVQSGGNQLGIELTKSLGFELFGERFGVPARGDVLLDTCVAAAHFRAVGGGRGALWAVVRGERSSLTVPNLPAPLDAVRRGAPAQLGGHIGASADEGEETEDKEGGMRHLAMLVTGARALVLISEHVFRERTWSCSVECGRSTASP